MIEHVFAVIGLLTVTACLTLGGLVVTGVLQINIQEKR